MVLCSCCHPRSSRPPPAPAPRARPIRVPSSIRTFAYGALGEPGPSDELLSSPTLQKIGDAHARSPEEVCLRWGLQGGCAVSIRPSASFGLGKSACVEKGGACRAGLRARASAFEWELAPAEMDALNAMMSPEGNPTLFSTSYCPGSFSFAQAAQASTKR